MTTITTATDLLTDEMLARFDERAATYDHENRFFDEDWDELRNSGYLLAAVPTEFGGSGLGLDEVARLQGKLAYYAPATAVAVNMHLYWTGVAADLLKAGDTSCAGCSRRRSRRGVRRHPRRGRQRHPVAALVLQGREGSGRVGDHRTQDLRQPFAGVDAGRLPRNGHLRSRQPQDRPRLPATQHVGLRDRRDVGHARHARTQSHDTVLDRAFVSDENIVLVCPAGFAGAGMFQVGIFAWALMGFATVYLGAAKRAFDITLEKMPKRSSIALTRSMAHHPGVQHNVSEMRISLDACEALLERVTTDWATGVPHADWPVRIVGARHFIINQAFDIVDRAMDLSGGSAVFKGNRLEQIFRDVRMGRFHPGNTLLAHELVGKLCLGLNPDDPQRWG